MDCNKLFLLFMLTTCSLAYGDSIYKVINIKIPQNIWKQALDPTPVLKSPVTVTVPINVQDNDNEVLAVDELTDEIEETEQNVETIVDNANDPVPVDPVAAVNDAVPAVSNSEPPVVSDPIPAVVNDAVVPVVVPQASPAPPVPALEDEVLPTTSAPPVVGQVIRFPCECRNGQCGCCTGALMERFRMKACGNMTFIPEDFVFDVKLNVNNNTVVHRRVSASDPPPICFNPRRAPFVRVCAEISNIQIRNRNAHACFDLNADIAGFPVFEAPFRCFSFGTSGLQSGKKPRPPISSTGPKPVNLFGNNDDDDDDDGLFGGGGGLFEGGDGDGLFGGGGGDGLFGGGGGESDDDGPLDGIGDAIGDFFDFGS